MIPAPTPVDELQIGHVGAAAPGTPDVLRERAEVRVVGHPDGQAEPGLHVLGRADPRPAGQDRRGAHRAAGVHRPGQAHPHAHDARAVRVRPRPARRSSRAAAASIAPSASLQLVELAPLLGEHVVGQVGHRHGQVALAQVDAHGQSGRGVERDQVGRAAAAPRGRVAVGLARHHQPLVLELGHDVRHRRAGQSGAPGDPGPAGYSGGAHGSHHAGPVGPAQGAQRTAPLLHGRDSLPAPARFVKTLSKLLPSLG